MMRLAMLGLPSKKLIRLSYVAEETMPSTSGESKLHLGLGLELGIGMQQ